MLTLVVGVNGVGKTTSIAKLAKRHQQKGDRVMLMIAAANRDPAQFPEPDRLDVRRKELRHQSFGMGPHYCVGAALGRVEAEETFAALLRRFPRMQVAPGPSPEWVDNVGFRGLKSLPVVLDPTA